jgi:peptide-methionine (R)-S-oxide reductase
MKVDKDELKKKLDPMTYEVTQEKGTEPPFTGKYVDEKSDGSYHCAVCGQKLFESGTKFDSGTGWPSFTHAVPGSVTLTPDHSHGMKRIEVTCSNCGAHLGHMFADWPVDPAQNKGKTKVTDFCVNSCALDLKKK